MHFDFDAAVLAPFRMQPGLRRLGAGIEQLTALGPGSRHQREKLAVLSAFAHQALVTRPGFDARPALNALCAHAASEQPLAWQWDGQRAQGLLVGCAVDHHGVVEQTAAGRFGIGDEVARCLLGLPAEWRLAGLLSLAFAEDFAVVDGRDATIPWLAVCLPSHWAPEDKVGQHFAAVHAPVADNTLLVKASQSLTRLVCGEDRWERFVWNITDSPRLHAHPARVGHLRWAGTAVQQAWWRTERQTFIALPAHQQAVFTIHVEVQPLLAALTTPQRAQALHDAVASMSDEVLRYRGLQAVQQPLLQWLATQATTA
jgi:dimethylamine monooxygenase subunit A